MREKEKEEEEEEEEEKVMEEEEKDTGDHLGIFRDPVRGYRTPVYSLSLGKCTRSFPRLSLSTGHVTRAKDARTGHASLRARVRRRKYVYTYNLLHSVARDKKREGTRVTP